MNSTYTVNMDSTNIGINDDFILPDCPSENRPRVAKLVSLMKKEIESRNGVLKVFSLNDFEIGCPLGRGKFGRVYLAREKKTQYIVALKTLFKSELKKNNMNLQLMREIEINCHLKHPNILKMFTYFHDEKRVYLVLEFAAMGELFAVQQKQSNRRFPEPQSAKYIHQVALGLDYCHSMKVIHRDIKPENLLLDINDNIKLADFGWSVHAPSNKRKTMCGTLDYLPPEMVRRHPYTHTVDNWCLGILCFEFLTGNPPFESSSQDETYRKIVNLSIYYPSFMSSGSKDLIRSLLKTDPSARLPLKDVVKHMWIVSQKGIPYQKPSIS